MDNMRLYHEKAVFVEEYLKPLCMRIDEHLTEVEYMPPDGTGLELVKLKWQTGGTKFADVTCDSLYAIACDVLRVMR